LRDSRILPPLLLVLSGVIAALAFPAPGLWPLCLVGLVPLFLFLNADMPASPALAGLAWGIGFFGCLLRWLYRFFHHYGQMDPVSSLALLSMLVAYLALYPALFSVVASRLRRIESSVAPLLMACAWVVLEWLRGHALSGFPWGAAGYALTGFLPAIQIAAVTGIYGISFLVVLVNLLLADWALRSSRNRRFFRAADAVTLALLAACVAWGSHQMAAPLESDEPVRVGLVQACVAQDQKWNPELARSILEKHETLTAEAAASGASLVLWPESSSPFPIAFPDRAQSGRVLPNTEYRQRLEALVRRLRVDLIFGTVDYRVVDGDTRPLNAAALLDSDGAWGRVYAKMHLVPFGEYVPMSGILGSVNRWVQGAIGDFLPGREAVVVEVGRLRVGTAICYEMIFPELVRRFVRSGATLLANLTNDAWFGRSAGPAQHFQMVRMRAVENRRYVVRAANTGISSVIDPCGRVLALKGLMQEGVLLGMVHGNRTMTFYSRHGDVFVILCAILTAAALATFLPRASLKIRGFVRDE
jgi:apolipoprotein N-acyltransferase